MFVLELLIGRGAIDICNQETPFILFEQPQRTFLRPSQSVALREFDIRARVANPGETAKSGMCALAVCPSIEI